MHLSCGFVDMFSAHFIKKIALASDSIASCAVIIEKKLTVYWISGYNSESLKNNENEK
ncbi:hypothetical protein BWGOE8_32280 [Bacillus mycoides]|uniref:Uncharacterized protein n=1 Tax=Bacillus mycoides TaxID=1405 RepID=A0A1E8B5Y6_BACMY|nr:hypothetical protein BWGOE8_32280 [Bacillus mycoides]OFD77646.1 hypothetical protein BWGOE9_32340 [Bacillus mycoides]OFD79046.1 hypothetical protein BWGOE10_32760 [Bacillus mycoides]